MDTDDFPRWTPFDERSQESSKTVDAKSARKNLGFESLFDTSDPNVSAIDDVVGLCSGQFVTQKPMPAETQATQSQLAGCEGTPDTVLMSQNPESQALSLSDFPSEPGMY